MSRAVGRSWSCSSLVPQPLCRQGCNPGQKKRKAAGGVHCLQLPLADHLSKPWVMAPAEPPVYKSKGVVFDH